MLLHIVGGARPNFVKLAPVMAALDRAAEAGGPLRYRFVHTGQHTDAAMSDDLLRALRMPEPHFRIALPGGLPEARFGAMVAGYASVLDGDPPDMVLVAGDVDSTLAAALAARRRGHYLGHLEAGLRCTDRTMPEEVNRRATDALADLFFTTTASACNNLLREGHLPDQIHFVGNTMVDSLHSHLPGEEGQARIAAQYGVKIGQFYFLTLHRPASVDSPEALRRRIDHIARACGDTPVVFAVHPRTAHSLGGGELPHPLRAFPPLPYREGLALMASAQAVITDSGGVSEECTALRIPCLIARDMTERPEITAIGSATIVGVNLQGLTAALALLRDGSYREGILPPLWDGHAAIRVVEVLQNLAAEATR